MTEEEIKDKIPKYIKEGDFLIADFINGIYKGLCVVRVHKYNDMLSVAGRCADGEIICDYLDNFIMNVWLHVVLRPFNMGTAADCLDLFNDVEHALEKALQLEDCIVHYSGKGEKEMFTLDELRSGDYVVRKDKEGIVRICLVVSFHDRLYYAGWCPSVRMDTFSPIDTGSGEISLVLRPRNIRVFMNLFADIANRITTKDVSYDPLSVVLNDIDVVYQKEEAKELTVEEISKLLGYEVKVVKG